MAKPKNKYRPIDDPHADATLAEYQTLRRARQTADLVEALDGYSALDPIQRDLIKRWDAGEDVNDTAKFQTAPEPEPKARKPRAS